MQQSMKLIKRHGLAFTIQMLFVLYSFKILHTGDRGMFLEVDNQFAPNRLFDVNYYKSILLNL